MTKENTRGRADNGSAEISDTERRRIAASVAAFDESLFDGARRALANAGFGALEYIAANPGVSEIELAKQLNRGTTTIGLLMAIYDEAARLGNLRDVAKDMLVRVIRRRFPHGWSSLSLDKLGTRFKIDDWRLDLLKYTRNPSLNQYALPIVESLAVANPPREGWTPMLRGDQFIDSLFDQFWPRDSAP